MAIESNGQGRDQIILRDYAKYIEEVLYVEREEGVQLHDVCEIGCKGILYITTDAKIIAVRHKTIGQTTATQLLEPIVVPIPEKFLSDNQKMYRDGVFEF